MKFFFKITFGATDFLEALLLHFFEFIMGRIVGVIVAAFPHSTEKNVNIFFLIVILI